MKRIILFLALTLVGLLGFSQVRTNAWTVPALTTDFPVPIPAYSIITVEAANKVYLVTSYYTTASDMNNVIADGNYVDLSGAGGGGVWTSTGDYIYPVSIDDSVGVGTNSPDYDFEVVGDARMANLFFVGGDAEFSANVDIADTLVADTIVPSTGQLYVSGMQRVTTGIKTDSIVGPAGGDWIKINSSGVGINKTPTTVLDVNGNILGSSVSIASTGQLSLTDNWAVDGYGIKLSGGVMYFYVNSPLTARASLTTNGDMSIQRDLAVNRNANIAADIVVQDTIKGDIITPEDSTANYFSNDIRVAENIYGDSLFVNYLGGTIGLLEVAGQAHIDTLLLRELVYHQTDTMLYISNDTVYKFLAPSGGGDTSYFDLSGNTMTRKDGIDSISFDTSAFSIEGNRFYTDPHNATCIFIGDEAGAVQSTHGNGNMGVGYRALYNVESGGLYNQGFGYQALQNVTYGDYNVAFGYLAGGNTSYSSNNIYIGRQAGFDNTGGSDNTIIGAYALGSGQYAYSLWLGANAGRYETEDARIYLDVYDRSNITNGRNYAPIYAIANTTASSQELYLGGTGKTAINGTLVQDAGTIANNDDTPDVLGANVWTYAGSANSVTITDLDNPVVGATYTIIGNSDTYTVTIADGGNFNLSAQWVGGLDDVLILYVQADNDYIELGRVDN